jgi:protein-S-isoprenylcysteine O-methyltransferase Ste14
MVLMREDPLLYRHLILWVWTAWALYWLTAAVGNKATLRGEPLSSRLAYALPLILGGVLLGWPQLPGAALLDLRLWPRLPLTYGAGLALLLGGLAFAVWARVQLGRNWSGAVTVKQGHELIRSGPYRHVRHPIYTGILAAVLGTAICSGTVRAALGLTIIAIALTRKLRREEALLRELFPDQYPQYCAEVPALVPFTAARRSAPR